MPSGTASLASWHQTHSEASLLQGSANRDANDHRVACSIQAWWPPMTYYVYIMANKARTLYTGVTNDLQRRVFEHQHGLTPGFTSR
jgi:hypothetical protein